VFSQGDSFVEDSQKNSSNDRGGRNIFADIIERRRDEGNVLKGIMPGKKGKRDPRATMMSRFIRLGVVGLGVVLIYGFLRMPNRDGHEQTPEIRKLRTDSDVLPSPFRENTSAVESSAPLSSETGGKGPIIRGPRGLIFHLPLPEFLPLKKLDPEILDYAMDSLRDITNPRYLPEASNIKGERVSIDHAYRFLRSHSEQALRKMANVNVRNSDFLRMPASWRGTLVNRRIVVLRIGTIFGWLSGHSKMESGIPDTTLLFVRNATQNQNPDIFLVLVPQPPWKFKERDVFDLTAMFLKRTPFKDKTRSWQVRPLMATMQLKPATIGKADAQNVSLVIVAVVVIGAIVLFFAVRGDTREREDSRRGRIERRKKVRQRSIKTASQRILAESEKDADDPGSDPPDNSDDVS
jgi:hypothetical protein